MSCFGCFVLWKERMRRGATLFCDERRVAMRVEIVDVVLLRRRPMWRCRRVREGGRCCTKGDDGSWWCNNRHRSRCLPTPPTFLRVAAIVLIVFLCVVCCRVVQQ